MEKGVLTGSYDTGFIGPSGDVKATVNGEVVNFGSASSSSLLFNGRRSNGIFTGSFSGAFTGSFSLKKNSLKLE